MHVTPGQQNPPSFQNVFLKRKSDCINPRLKSSCSLRTQPSTHSPQERAPRLHGLLTSTFPTSSRLPPPSHTRPDSLSFFSFLCVFHSSFSNALLLLANPYSATKAQPRERFSSGSFLTAHAPCLAH